MSYQIIPQHYRDLINNQYPQINDEHKKQLGELWSVLFENGGAEQTGPQFDAFLQQQIENVNDDPQLISDRIDAKISQIEGLTGGKKKRRNKKSSKKRNKKSSKRRNKKSRKNKKSYKKRK